METEEQVVNPSKMPRRMWSRIRRSFMLYVVVPYVSVIVICGVFQRRLMYQPTVANSLRIATVDSDPAFGRDAELTTADGNTLRGWLLYGDNRHTNLVGKAPLVLYFPGNAQNRYERIDDLREVAARGFDVLIFDYRGFGDSTGSPTESNLSADALLVWIHVRDKLGYDEQRTVIFGESLGGAVALSMWSSENPVPPRPAAVILNSPFTSMQEIVAWHYPLFPFQFLLLDRWPSIERIAQVDVPVIVFHGTKDEIVPVAQGRALTQASSHARLIEIPGGTHNEIPMMRLRQELDAIIAVMSRADRSVGLK